MAAIRRLTSPELTPDEIRELRALFAAAWPDPDEAFADEDWQHALGGVHVLLEEDGRILSHASVVPRVLEVGRVPLDTGYVEAVATWPELQRRGHGSAVMRQIGDVIAASYQLGALGTGEFAFYGRLGWERWRGPTLGANAGRRGTHAGRGRLHHGPAHGLNAARPGSRRDDQLRVALRRRLVGGAPPCRHKNTPARLPGCSRERRVSRGAFPDRPRPGRTRGGWSFRRCRRRVPQCRVPSALPWQSQCRHPIRR